VKYLIYISFPLFFFCLNCSEVEYKCRTLHYKVYIQNEVVRNADIEEIEATFWEVWNHTVAKFEEIDIHLVLDDLIISMEPDGFSEHPNHHQRLYDNYEETGYWRDGQWRDRGYGAIVMGLKFGKSYDWAWFDSDIYCVLALHSQGTSPNWSKYLLIHALGHQYGAMHDYSDCNFMVGLNQMNPCNIIAWDVHFNLPALAQMNGNLAAYCLQKKNYGLGM
jgi:hypothetical protein